MAFQRASHALLTWLSFLMSWVINKGRVKDAVFMHFIKAFEKVHHGKLIQKIKMHAIHSELAVWI